MASVDVPVALLGYGTVGAAVHRLLVESADDRATVEATLTADDEVTATCRGTFVAVKPDHPAYNRW